MGKILLIGRNGQVTTYLQARLSNRYDLVVVGSDEFDLTKPDELEPILDNIEPSLIVNPAAYTAVDAAEENQETAYLVNRDAVASIAKYSAANSVPLIHFSTDYVFPGNASEPYTEDDITGPSGVYGRSKLAGEQVLIDSGAPALVLRTSWVYSNHGKNFYKTMLALSESRSELNVVNDQIGAPTYAGSIAEATKSLIDIISDQGEIFDAQKGVYHFTCQGQTSWAEFAKAIFVENELSHMKVNGIPSTDYPTLAERPAFSVLSNKKLMRVFGLSLPHWGTALGQCVAESKEHG